MMNDDDILLLPSNNDSGRTSLAYGSAHPAVTQTRPEGLRRLHQLLRGRYAWAVVLGLTCGTIGAVVGYRSEQPAFRAKALITFPMTQADMRQAQDAIVPAYSYMVNTQVLKMTSRGEIENAMQMQQWTSLGRPYNDQAIEDFANSLDVEQSPGSEIVVVSFTDLDENAARAGAEAVYTEYQLYAERSDPQGLKTRYKYWTEKENTLNTSLRIAKSKLEGDVTLAGTDELGELVQDNLIDANNKRLAEESAEKTLDDVQAAYERQKAQFTPIPADAKNEDIAALDPKMSLLLKQQTDEQLHYNALLVNGLVADNNPQTIVANRELTAATNAVQDEREYFMSTYKKSWPEFTSPGQVAPLPHMYTQADIDQAKSNLQTAKAQFDLQTKYANGLSTQNEQIIEDRNTINDLTNGVNEANRYIEDLSTKIDTSNQNSLLEDSNHGVPSTEKTNDKRRTMGFVGGLLGAAFPTALLLMLGLIDSRFRYSDEATGDLSGAPLLGILPNLPDLLTDPAQAAIAAHCVHQIRTLLQINGSTFGRNVFAITSASAGDGKTSLTLALGLSFAASGSRTLLIDCDLVGAGLTARLNVHSPQGVLEAMANRKVLEFVHSTDVADLSVLPVGESLGGYTGTVSPGAIRRLVDGARAHFDTILIDTGPVLGSIEASPVAVAADATILCVSRGQQRPLVDKSMALLASIGARMAGVVFNRAQAQDFEQSISRMSLPPGSSNGRKKQSSDAGGSPFGPVAKAVASSVKSGAGNRQ